MNREQKAALWLAMHEYIGAIRANRLRELAGSYEAIRKLPIDIIREEEILKPKELALWEACTITDSMTDRMEERLDKMGIRLVIPEDPDYPKRLKSLRDSPAWLFARGSLPSDEIPSAAIVGARSCTDYGREQAEFIGRLLARYGIQVISGLAEGVDEVADGHAHTAAALSRRSGLRIVGHLGDAVGDEGGGEGKNAAENVGILQAVADGAVAAHGETADKGILYLVGDMEDFPGEFGQLAADELLIHGVAGGIVDVEAVLTGGAENCHVVHGGQLVDAAASDPVGMGAGITMEKNKETQRRLGRRRRSGEHGSAGGDAGSDLGVPVHAAGEKAEFKYCHDSCFLSYLFKFVQLLQYGWKNAHYIPPNIINVNPLQINGLTVKSYKRFLMKFGKKRYALPAL